MNAAGIIRKPQGRITWGLWVTEATGEGFRLDVEIVLGNPEAILHFQGFRSPFRYTEEGGEVCGFFEKRLKTDVGFDTSSL